MEDIKFSNFLLGIETNEYEENFYRQLEIKKIEKLKELHKSKIELSQNFYFLTINPDTSKVSLQTFLKTIEKAISKKWITYYIYVIEQRGETLEEAGKGYHTHIIFNKGKKHSEVIREMSNSFKKMCDVSNYHLFNLKRIGDEEKNRKIEYITGQKADEEKHLKQSIDKIFREKEKLKSYYILEDGG